jgi:hypothetical protein
LKKFMGERWFFRRRADFGKVLPRYRYAGKVIGRFPLVEEVIEGADAFRHGDIWPVGWFPVLVFAFVVPAGG